MKAIGDCQSKCILVGVGKSGHLANLIASSLNSIGASSFDDNVRQLFAQRDVHAAETQSLNSIISEITGGLPKPLVDINGTPLIQRQIDLLKKKNIQKMNFV